MRKIKIYNLNCQKQNVITLLNCNQSEIYHFDIRALLKFYFFTKTVTTPSSSLHQIVTIPPRKQKKKQVLIFSSPGESATSSKERIEELEIGFGMMQDEVMKICKAMNEKFRYMEESMDRLMEAVTSNHNSGSSVPRGNQRTNKNQPYASVQYDENTNPFTPPPPHQHVKLEFPLFQGGDLTSWISKTKQYFFLSRDATRLEG